MTVKLILERKSMKNFPDIEIRRKVVEVEIPDVDNLEQEEKRSVGNYRVCRSQINKVLLF